MKRITLENIGREVIDKRANTGIRAMAAEIGISPSTLSRIENGHLPDLDTFRKVCEWLGANPGDVLGSKASSSNSQQTTVHFKKDKTLDLQTAQDLAQMILAAQRALDFQKEAGL